MDKPKSDMQGHPENNGWIPVEEDLPDGNAMNPITNNAYVYPVTVNLGDGLLDVRYYSF